MREELDRLLEDLTLLTIAFAIALGWSLFQLAHGVATFIDGLTVHVPAGTDGGQFFGQGGGLSWIVDRHIISLDGILTGLVELASVLLVAVFVRSRFGRDVS
jgi:hypothetical protein